MKNILFNLLVWLCKKWLVWRNSLHPDDVGVIVEENLLFDPEAFDKFMRGLQHAKQNGTVKEYIDSLQ